MWEAGFFRVMGAMLNLAGQVGNKLWKDLKPGRRGFKINEKVAKQSQNGRCDYSATIL